MKFIAKTWKKKGDMHDKKRSRDADTFSDDNLHINFDK